MSFDSGHSLSPLDLLFLGPNNIIGKLKTDCASNLFNPEPASTLSSSNSLLPQSAATSQQQHQQSLQINTKYPTPTCDASTTTMSASASVPVPMSMPTPIMDVGKASLMQMSEMSRRAKNWTDAGSVNWNGGEASSSTHPGQNATGLLSTGSLGGMSGTEVISKIEKVYRMRTSSVSSSFDVSTNPQWTIPSSSSSVARRHQQQQDGGAASTSPTRTYNTSDAPNHSVPPPLPPSSSSQPPSSQPQAESQPQPPSTSSFWNLAGSSVDDSELSKASLAHEGLQVYTVGQLMPRDELVSTSGMTANQWNLGALPLSLQPMINAGSSGPVCVDDVEREEEEEETEGDEEEEEEKVMPSPVNAAFAGRTTLPSSATSSTPIISNKSPRSKRSLQNKHRRKRKDSSAPTAASEKKLRVRRSTFIPRWAVPPRVLLVDDDIVSRTLGSKFLQVYGCTIDVAVDGESAVEKMNFEKYDLVLMVRYGFFIHSFELRVV